MLIGKETRVFRSYLSLPFLSRVKNQKKREKDKKVIPDPVKEEEEITVYQRAIPLSSFVARGKTLSVWRSIPDRGSRKQEI